jgi:signal transduction histidine kinase
METGQRGFIITGEPSFLEPWEIGRRTLPERVATLRKIVDDAGQAKRAEQLETASLAYIRDYSVPLVDAARRGEGWVRGIPASEDGKRRMDSLRGQLDAYVTTEFALSAAEQADADNDHRRATFIAASGLAASVLMTVLITIYLARRVVRPVRRTAMTAKRIAAGELDARVPETSNAEVGVLERAFNSMAESLQHHVGELARLSDEQAALRRVATLVARGRPSDEVFAAVAEEMARCVRVMHATVSRYDAGAFIPVAIYHGDRLRKLPADLRLPLEGDNVAARVFRCGRTARMDSHDDAAGLHAARIRELGIRSAVGVPIIVDGRVWGAAIVGSSAPEPLPPDTEARLGDFADLVATAIANAATRAELIASRARIVAAADDARRRIERDLHDGAQQRLVAVGVQLRLAETSVPPELPPLRAQLGDIVTGLTGVSADLQEISRGIHPAILSKGGLGPALKTLARRSAVPVDLDLAIDRRLPDSVEVGAYYVVSEALTNAAKHARASVVKVGIETEGANIHLSIRDDGIGGADAAKGSGLIGLTDRVEALGGTLTVISPPGQGTSLQAELPLSG